MVVGDIDIASGSITGGEGGPADPCRYRRGPGRRHRHARPGLTPARLDCRPCRWRSTSTTSRKLARVELTDDEKARMRDQLAVILEHAAKVGEVAADDVPPTASPIPQVNVFREDSPEPSLSHDAALANAPASAGRAVPGAEDRGDRVVTELCDRTGSELSEGLRDGEITAVALAESAIARREALDGRVAAFLTPTPEVALERAAAFDTYLATGAPQTGVAGIPLALKDVLTTKGIRTTCGSKILETYVPPYDATAWTRLSGAGSVLVGKTNCDEFAMGSSNENSAFGPVHNPWDLDTRARAARAGAAPRRSRPAMAVWALGTDTGGSVRQPASLSGVVGLKPTYGRISRYGLIAFASSLDTVGTFTRSVRDAATLLGVMAGQGPPRRHEPGSPSARLRGGHRRRALPGCASGVLAEAFGEGVEPDVARLGARRRSTGWPRSAPRWGRRRCRTRSTRSAPTT